MPTGPWLLASEAGDVRDIPIAFLDGSPLGAFTARVYLGPKNRYGAFYFQLVLRDGAERESQPVLQGLASTGEFPAYNWIEVSYFQPRVVLIATEKMRATSADLTAKGLVEPLLKRLADLIPPGGHLMVEYDSPEQEETRQGLERGYPPAVTPLGNLLFRIGCGLSFKDWYFAEGGAEGPRKLQGFKPLSEEAAHSNAMRLAAELDAFIVTHEGQPADRVEERAVERARDVLHRLRESAETGKRAGGRKGAIERARGMLKRLRGKGKRGVSLRGTK